MAMSIFDDKSKQPIKQMLAKALGKQYQLWADIAEYVIEKYAKAIEEWKYPGVKYGWSFRLKDKKRNIIYMMPCDSHIMVAFAFSDKALTLCRIVTCQSRLKMNCETPKNTPKAEASAYRCETKPTSPTSKP
jgi:hypothetical protein